MKSSLAIELPVKIILNEDGIDWFIKHGKTPRRINLADRTTDYGIALDRVTPSLLKSMITLDYVSKIEIARVEFSSKRKEILRLSEIITDNILFKKFDNEVFDAFISSDLIKRWNRSNPSKIIDRNTRFNKFYIQSMMNENRAIIEGIVNEITYPMKQAIMKTQRLEDGEKKGQIAYVEQYIGSVRDPVWVLLSQFRDRVGFSEIIIAIRGILSKYMGKAKIVEYIGLIVVELATNAENVRIEETARIMYPKTDNLRQLIFSKKVRNEIYNKLKSEEDYLYLTWKLGGKSTSIGTENRLQIILFNQEYDYSRIKKEIENKSDIDLKEKSLHDFYNELPEQKKDIELGLYYLSYLHEECKKQNIRFESYVGQSSRNDLTVITLDLQF